MEFQEVRLWLSLTATKAVKQSLEGSEVITDSEREVIGELKGGSRGEGRGDRAMMLCSKEPTTVECKLYRTFYSV